MTHSIAIVGLGCIYPDAQDPRQLWENVLAGRRAFRPIPYERLNSADYVSSDRTALDRTYAAQAAVLSNYEFDRQRFRVSSSTYEQVDLTHWLALDVAAQALADAGFPEALGLPKQSTGILVGNSLTGEFSRANLLRLRWPYVRRVVTQWLAQSGVADAIPQEQLIALEQAYKAPFPPTADESLAGGLSNTIAGRIANHFDLQGGGFTVDGACASSLLAVANACSFLAAGDQDVMLAGGVDLSLDPFELVGFAKVGALAEKEMRVYDRSAEGFWPGEGCGFVVLMRTADAQQQNRRIYATIEGWGISADGSGGITRPETKGQLLALERAYRRAGFGLHTVGYLEGHGTGTTVGDATELETLISFRQQCAQSQSAHDRIDQNLPTRIGSIKANIGHTKAAAGVAGLIKATLALHEQIVPPHVGARSPHALLQRADAGIETTATAAPWHDAVPLRAGVSAMGFGGINAHIAMQSPTRHRHRRWSRRVDQLVHSRQDVELCLFSAPNKHDLAARIARVRERADRLSQSELIDLAVELARKATGGPYRAAVLGRTPDHLSRALDELLASLASEGASAHQAHHPVTPADFSAWEQGSSTWSCHTQPPRVGFLFPGQASPPYRDGGAWSQRFTDVDSLYSHVKALELAAHDSTRTAQPLVVTAELAGLRVLESVGLRANVAVGHSLGELTAYAWAGALPEDEVQQLAILRGELMDQFGAEGGAMASFATTAEVIESWLESHQDTVVAACNSPRQTVIAGPSEAIEQCLQRARELSMTCTRLSVSHAFHSPGMSAAREPLRRAAEMFAWRPLQATVVSTVTGDEVTNVISLPELIEQQLTRPVRFTQAWRKAQPLADWWIEVGPGRVLSGLTRDAGMHNVLSLDCGGESLEGLLRVVGTAFVHGWALNLEPLFEDRLHRPFDWQPRFLASPCEMPFQRHSPVSSEGSASPPNREREPDPTAAVPAHSQRVEPSKSDRIESDRIESEGALPDNDVDASTLDKVRRAVAARADLPLACVGPHDRLLGDLHLSSIAVGQLIAELAKSLRIQVPAAPTEFATATVMEVATALDELADTSPVDSPKEPVVAPGIDAWVRPFAVELVDAPLAVRSHHRESSRETEFGRWQTWSSPGDPLANALMKRLTTESPRSGILVCLPPDRDSTNPEDLLAAAQAAQALPRPAQFVLVNQGWSSASFARSLYLEQPELDVCIVHVPAGAEHAVEWICAEAMNNLGFTEAHYNIDGLRQIPGLTLLPASPSANWSLLSNDVVLVTGGGKGIAAECALHIGEETGARLALWGRSDPTRDTVLASNLRRFADRGIEVRYEQVDVAQPRQVALAMRELTAEWGPVTMVLHAAGKNVPQRLEHLTDDALRQTLLPKVDGLRHVLDHIDASELQALVTFGSIIGRAGMAGEAHYALANEWQTQLTSQWHTEHPHCRCLALEWSVWAGVGMGERLGTLGALKRSGILPIGTDEGVRMLSMLLDGPMSVVPIVISSRLGRSPTLHWQHQELPLLRFLDESLVHVPGVELVVQNTLSTDSDPYVTDHVYQGVPLLPAVAGLEAMAQAAVALTRNIPKLPAFRFQQLEFERPIVVPSSGEEVIQLSALASPNGVVSLALRAGESEFQVDHFRGDCVIDSGGADIPHSQLQDELGVLRRAQLDADEQSSTPPLSTTSLSQLPIDPQKDVYGPLLFHTGRFQCVESYEHLTATECIAILRPVAEVTFGSYLPSEWVLGNVAMRDAMIHAIQACIPHGTVLPVAVEEITIYQPSFSGPRRLLAVERRGDGETFIYDLEALTLDGQLIERWQGLTLRRVGRLTTMQACVFPLLAPYFERRLAELIPGCQARVGSSLTEDERASGLASAAAVTQTLGREAHLTHRPDGKPEIVGSPQKHVSLSHDQHWTLAITADHDVACDIESVVERTPEVWEELLGPSRVEQLMFVASESGESYSQVATRVWCAVECLKKAGLDESVPLIFRERTTDDWILFGTNSWRVATWVAPGDCSAARVYAFLVKDACHACV